ncbi:MAG TPA: hypothetical protein VLD37_03110 [Candidatus Bilamarchaeum sp.]|nr:hypothetical protein [Candidatus Bilamarchaeum sp.]
MRFAILAVAILLALHGCTGAAQQNGNQTGNGTTNQSDGGPGPGEGPTMELCQAAGGHWNTQGTCCRDLAPGQVCNKLCVAVCDCGGIAGFKCPTGYTCTDYYPPDAADAMGVCRKV